LASTGACDPSTGNNNLSSSLRRRTKSITIATEDAGVNLSDHRAIIDHFMLSNVVVCSSTGMEIQKANTVLPACRWDQTDTSLYYEASIIGGLCHKYYHR